MCDHGKIHIVPQEPPKIPGHSWKWLSWGEVFMWEPQGMEVYWWLFFNQFHEKIYNQKVKREGENKHQEEAWKLLQSPGRRIVIGRYIKWICGPEKLVLLANTLCSAAPFLSWPHTMTHIFPFQRLLNHSWILYVCSVTAQSYSDGSFVTCMKKLIAFFHVLASWQRFCVCSAMSKPEKVPWIKHRIH